MEANVYTEMERLFTGYLAEKSLRKTEERYAILREVCAFSGHFDVTMLQASLERDHFHVSKATLYNTLDVLVDAGLVVRHPLNARSLQYELRLYADTHLHLICTRCGRVREMQHAALKSGVRELKIPRFTPKHYCLYIYGLCSRCKARMQRADK